eukprot:7376-Amphidinium_carterae.1
MRNQDLVKGRTSAEVMSVRSHRDAVRVAAVIAIHLSIASPGVGPGQTAEHICLARQSLRDGSDRAVIRLSGQSDSNLQIPPLKKESAPPPKKIKIIFRKYAQHRFKG